VGRRSSALAVHCPRTVGVVDIDKQLLILISHQYFLPERLGKVGLIFSEPEFKKWRR
jgi:hypothetical protein